MTPIVYTKPGCSKCRATYRELDKLDINYVSIDVSVETEEYERLQELGFQEMPVVYAKKEYWTGFRPDKIQELKSTDGE